MRTLTANAQTAIEADVTRPRYLIEIGFDPVLRYSTIGEVDWDGYTWIPNGAQVSGLRTSPDGTSTGRLILPNQDRAFGAMVIAQRVRNRSCRVWMLYGEAPFAEDDAVQVFDGFMDGVPVLGSRVEIELVSLGANGTKVPLLTMAKALGTGLPTPGDRIRYFNADILLHSQKG